MDSVEDSIRRQLEINRSRNLLYENLAQLIRLEPTFLGALEELLDPQSGDPPAAAYSEIVAFTAREMINRILLINPYLPVNSEQIQALEEIYRQTWQTMKRTGEIETTLSQFHYPALSKWLAALYPGKFREVLKSSAKIAGLTYGEYSAALQLELLGIDPSLLKQPVLDIGCGSQATLVRHLRALGIEAYGIDRRLGLQESYLEQVDWFAYDFQPDRWGTVVSNMAFTNHLNYAYLHDISQLERYLSTMKKILQSLSMGGSFHYAPGLPSVEAELSPKIFKVEQGQTFGGLFVSVVTRIARDRG